MLAQPSLLEDSLLKLQEFQKNACNRASARCVFWKIFDEGRGAGLTRRRVLLIGGCAIRILRAQNDDEPVYDLASGITPPRIIKQVNPRYPTDRGVRAVGSVVIALVVTSKGLPKDPHVVKGLDQELDQSAVDAVKEWRFAPAEKNSKPIAVRISVQLQFHEM